MGRRTAKQGRTGEQSRPTPPTSAAIKREAARHASAGVPTKILVMSGTDDKEVIVEQTRMIAVATDDERGLEGQVAEHFGRCPAYVVVKATGREIQDAQVVPNPHFQTHQPGQVPRFVRGLGVDAILAGGMGPRAIDLFSQFGIEVATGVTGSVRDVVGAYLRGDASGTVPCAHDHPDSCGGGHHASQR